MSTSVVGDIGTVGGFRKQAMERRRKMKKHKRTSSKELKVALANVFTGAIRITCRYRKQCYHYLKSQFT